MSALLRHDDSAASSRRAPTAWSVRGVRYANSAAKFWMGLIDEALELHPAATALDVSALVGRGLAPDLLNPADALGLELERMAGRDFAEAMRETLAEMEMFGPPGAVAVRVRRGDTVLLARELPLECVDAEVFPYLLVWLPEWASIGPSRWNEETLAGSFEGRDDRRQRAYRIDFIIRRRHINEGLYELGVQATPVVAATG